MIRPKRYDQILTLLSRESHNSRICPEIAAVLRSLGIDLSDLLTRVQVREYKNEQVKRRLANEYGVRETEGGDDEDGPLTPPQNVSAERLLGELDALFPEGKQD